MRFRGFAHPHPNGPEVADRIGTRRIHRVVQARLIPFNSDRLYNRVDQPALVFPAFHPLLDFCAHHRRLLHLDSVALTDGHRRSRRCILSMVPFEEKKFGRAQLLPKGDLRELPTAFG
jgi:hypothetical protein